MKNTPDSTRTRIHPIRRLLDRLQERLQERQGQARGSSQDPGQGLGPGPDPDQDQGPGLTPPTMDIRLLLQEIFPMTTTGFNFKEALIFITICMIHDF